MSSTAIVLVGIMVVTTAFAGYMWLWEYWEKQKYLKSQAYLNSPWGKCPHCENPDTSYGPSFCDKCGHAIWVGTGEYAQEYDVASALALNAYIPEGFKVGDDPTCLDKIEE